MDTVFYLKHFYSTIAKSSFTDTIIDLSQKAKLCNVVLVGYRKHLRYELSLKLFPSLNALLTWDLTPMSLFVLEESKRIS